MPKRYHPISKADAAAMAGLRAMLASQPAMHIVPEKRGFFDQMIEATPAPDNVTYDDGLAGGVPGWWCRPQNAAPFAAILYLHGGGYIIGSAAAYRHPAGQIAAKSGVSAFVVEYGLAPERPFPAAFDDALAAYDGLVKQGITRIVIGGDSAGGGLTLALCAAIAARGDTAPAAAVAISPLTDLTASGESCRTCAAADPILNREEILACAATYLSGGDPGDPRASPLFGPASGLPHIQIHVGQDEVLLDDSTRYADMVEQTGGSVDLHVWEGMPHVFTSSIAVFEAARSALRMIGSFIADRVAGPGLEDRR